MVDQSGMTITCQDRALLRAVLEGQDLQEIARARGQTTRHERLELRRLLAQLAAERQPPTPDRRRPAPLC